MHIEQVISVTLGDFRGGAIGELQVLTTHRIGDIHRCGTGTYMPTLTYLSIEEVISIVGLQILACILKR